MEDLSAASVSGSVDVATPIENNSVSTDSTSEFNFRDHISDEYKSSKSLEPYKDLNGLVKSHIELNKTMGSSIRVPGEEATPEELEKFYSKLGRPEAADKYEFSDLGDMPEGLNISDERTNEFKEIAHKLGLTAKQANELRTYYTNQEIEQYKQGYVSEEQQEQDFISKGKEMFGDKYDAIMQNTSKLIAENLPEEQRDVLNKLDNEQLLTVSKILNNINGKFMKPDTISSNYRPADTVQDQKNTLQSLREKQKTIDVFHPEYETIQSKIKELYAKGVKLY